MTYALARLAHATGQRLDLIAIWNAQETSKAVDEAIEQLAHIAYRVLTDPDRPSANVTEWAKRAECWERMLLVDWQLRSTLTPHLLVNSASTDQDEVSSERSAPRENPTIAVLAGVSGETFLAIAAWAKQTDELTSFKRELAHRIGVALKQGKELTSRQRPQAAAILEEARSAGFSGP